MQNVEMQLVKYLMEKIYLVASYCNSFAISNSPLSGLIHLVCSRSGYDFANQEKLAHLFMIL